MMLTLAPDKATLADLRRAVPNRIGFGSGHLYASDRKAALDAIRTALDCGVTYFDTARLYGSGSAEGLLGEALAGRRREVVLASKAGIWPASRSVGKRIVDRALVMGRSWPVGRAILPAPRPALPVFGAFDRAALGRSLEMSLKRLRTDYLDVFLLHECQLEDVRRDEVRRFAEDALAKGKVRLVGTATDPANSRAIIEEAPFGSVVQVAVHPWLSQMPEPKRGELVITHSSLGPDLPGFVSRLAKDRGLAEMLQARTETDAADKGAVAALLLRYAMTRNRQGFVIFASRSAARVRENIRFMTGSELSSEHAAGLEAVVAACAVSSVSASQ